jgi:5'-3' exonuclease
VHLHLVDGTYELFRSYYGAPPATAPDGREVGAVRGLLASLGSLLRESGVTHVACAFDTVIESFRNGLFPGYKTGDGIDPPLWAQFPLAERAVASLGVVVWSMVEFEADDALATAAVRYGADHRVERVWICTPDKDLAQMVKGDRIVAFDRKKKQVLDEAGVQAKFGVAPASIPDLLALVGAALQASRDAAHRRAARRVARRAAVARATRGAG